jgi:hypothetical protein
LCRRENRHGSVIPAPPSVPVRALTAELLNRRTMAGAEVDEVIAAAVAAKSIGDEHQRRAAWKRIEQSAASFADLCVVGNRAAGCAIASAIGVKMG